MFAKSCVIGKQLAIN